MAKETAEQKLLKILEASGQAPVNPSAKSKGKGKSFGVKLSFSVAVLNLILIILILVCAAYLFYEINSGSQLLKRPVEIDAGVAAARNVNDITDDKINDISYYAEKISKRNIFKPYEKEQLEKAGSSEEKPGLAKKMLKFKLVGVAWLDLPESASIMVEDTSSGMTYFLREGEKLEDVTVKTIYIDQAVFSYENEEITIKL